ncbi:fluoride efflux transporter CrcB [Bacillus smithii]|uniref:fluoride efflux transporter CrcB n=1 Tax=Bacillus smithii TaxID=1479 RepID=UPI003D23EDB4
MNLLAIGIGGFFGAILRYSVGKWIPATNGFPVGTLLINLAGCLFLAWFFTITEKRWMINPQLKLAIGTGFTGAFTTFSTFSVETLNLIEHQQFFIALIYLLLSVGGGIGFAIIGAKLATFNIQQSKGGTEE